MRLELLVRALAARAPQVLLRVLRRRQARPQPRRLAVGGEVIRAAPLFIFYRDSPRKCTQEVYEWPRRRVARAASVVSVHWLGHMALAPPAARRRAWSSHL